MPAAFDMSGKVALITGASDGLGRHFATVLARAGARVVLGARRREKLEQAVAEIAGEGGSASAVAIDVSAQASVQQAFEELDRTVGPVGGVINNAGTTINKPLLDLTEAEWDGVVDTNVKGVWLVMREAARRMVDAK